MVLRWFSVSMGNKKPAVAGLVVGGLNNPAAD
jgi:hypothetical protein